MHTRVVLLTVLVAAIGVALFSGSAAASPADSQQVIQDDSVSDVDQEPRDAGDHETDGCDPDKAMNECSNQELTEGEDQDLVSDDVKETADEVTDVAGSVADAAGEIIAGAMCGCGGPASGNPNPGAQPITSPFDV